MVLCWRDSSHWDIVLVLVLDLFGNGLCQLYFFDYEDDDEDEQQSNQHFRRFLLGSLPQTAPKGLLFSSVVSEKT